MRPQVLFPALALILAMLACNFPVATPPVTETPTLFLLSPSATLSLPTAAATFTPLPTNTAPPPPTSTVPIVSPNGINVNCRLGPGTAWVPLSALVVGQTAQITGRSTDNTWWLVNDPLNPGRGCWVAASVVVTGGNLSGIGVVQSPTATVTNVTVGTDPKVVSVPGCSGTAPTIKINGTIETNGPTEVTWRFETQQSGADADPDHHVRQLWRHGFLRGLHADDRSRDVLGQAGDPQPEQHPGRGQLSDRLSVVPKSVSKLFPRSAMSGGWD